MPGSARSPRRRLGCASTEAARAASGCRAPDQKARRDPRSSPLASRAAALRTLRAGMAGLTSLGTMQHPPRTAHIRRETRETRVEVVLNLDGTGRGDIATGVGFLDH